VIHEPEFAAEWHAGLVVTAIAAPAASTSERHRPTDHQLAADRELAKTRTGLSEVSGEPPGNED
jgi:hypothetical protein